MKLNDIIDLKGDWASKVRDKLAEATYVGIDFGTSTTTVTYLRYDEETGTLIAEPLKVAQEDEQGVRTYDHLVPTVIAMLPGGHLIFGCGAKECPLGSQKFAEGMNVWSTFKMHLGEAMCYPRSRMTRLNTPVRGQIIEKPRDATKLFFAYLKSAIEEKVREEGLPSRVHYAITVPASFGPNQREDLCAAIRDAGIEIVPAAILDEPNSAFIGAVSEYAAEGGTAMFFRDGKPCKVLVFDFGAGTCDVSVLDIDRDLVLQNLAVSHFTALGGRDIDERIAEDFLYPKLLGDRTGDDIPVASVKKCLIDKLRPVAEIIKIRLSEKHDDDYGAKAFELAAESPSSFVEEGFYQATQQYGVFESNELRVTAEEFAALMRRFSEDPMEAFDNDHKSILDPVEDALHKAGIKKEELDFVLLVGGSSKNPFVRDVLEEYFPRPVTLVRTRDPRTLVAEGAAFHSLVCNGLDSTFMRPITSEEIVVSTPAGPVTVFPAGTPVPTSWKEIPDLYIDDESARCGKFIVPFNSANGRREWGKVRFSLPDLDGGCDVGLSCSLSEDKTLAYQIKVNGEMFSGALRNPLTSSEVSADERDYIAKQNALEYTAMMLGVPSVEQYKAVARASRKLRRYEEEAEHYRQLMYAHREAHFEYEAARAFRDAHKRKEALAWSRKACKYNPDYLNVWYLVWDLAAIKGWDDHETQTWLERALASWPDDLDFKYVDMKCLEGCGQKDEAKGRAEELCEAWEEEGIGNLGKYTLIRFDEVARICEKRQLAVEIRKRLDLLSDEEEFGRKDASYASVRSRTLDDEKKGGK